MAGLKVDVLLERGAPGAIHMSLAPERPHLLGQGVQESVLLGVAEAAAGELSVAIKIGRTEEPAHS
jgi:hypothetical protein